MTTHKMYRIVRAKGSKTGDFVNIADPEALATCRAYHGGRDLQISAATWKKPDLSSPSRLSLYWLFASYSIDLIRGIALGVLEYLSGYFAVPEDFITVLYNAGGGADTDPARSRLSGRRLGLDGTRTPTPAEIVVVIPPPVFDPPTTPLMPRINYRLARQMKDDGIAVDIDVYAKDQQFLPLVNSINSATGRHITSVSKRELLYLDGTGLLELSKQPRSDDTDAKDRYVPQAATWFAQTLQEQESRQKWQSQLRQTLMKTGWQVPPCIRRLHWEDLSEDETLEACRVVARFYPFISAGEEEVWHHVRRLERRHGIRESARLGVIIAFGSKNPGFPGCDTRSCRGSVRPPGAVLKTYTTIMSIRACLRGSSLCSDQKGVCYGPK